MSNYSKTTDFAAKDSLPSGDSGKIIRGSEFETEFDAISTAIATKADAADPTFTGTVTIDGLTVNGNTTLGNAATDTVTVTADIASNLIPSADDTYNLGASGAEWNDLYVDGVAYIDAINFNGTAITATGAEINYLDITTLGTVEASKAVTADGSGHVTFPDDKQFRMGASDDLKIYHNSSNGNSIIAETGSGALSLHTNGSEINFYDSGNARQLASFTTGGATTFRHDGDIKLATTATGADVTGTLVADGLTVDGNSTVNGTIAVAGTSPKIFFSESDTTDLNTRVRSNGGNFQVQSVNNSDASPVTRFNIQNSTGDISFYEDTGTTAKFFWDAGTERLGIGNSSPTTALDVTGTVTADGLTSQAGANATDILSLSGSAAGRTLTVQSYDTTLGGAGFDINASASAGEITLQTNTKDRLRVKANGDISFFEDTGTTAKFYWDSSAEFLGIGTDDPSSNLEVKGSTATTNTGATVLVTDSASLAANVGGAVAFRGTDGSSDRTYGLIKGGKTDATSGSFSGYLSFQTRTNGQANTTERMRIDSSGNVGIGTSNPAQKLVIDGGSSNAILRIQGDSVLRLDFGASTDADAGRIEYDSTGNSMRFYTDNTEAMRIDNSGNLLFGKTASGTNNVGTQISNDGFAAIVNTNNNIPLYLENKATSGNCRISFTNDSHGGASFGLNNGGDFTIFDTTASTTRFNVTSAKILTASGGLAGIQLGGTTSANTLDDYEEGTFTPTYTPETGSFTTLTMDVVAAKYTKVGNLVTISVFMRTDDVDVTGASGDVIVTGLPFLPTAYSPISVGSTGNWATSGNYPQGGYIFNDGGTGKVILKTQTSANGPLGTDVTVSDLKDGTITNANTITINATYFTNA